MTRHITIPPEVAALLRRLQSAGFAAYAVGGCVRDSLLGREIQDWDICTAAAPEQTIACFSDHRTVLTGIRYGTVTVLTDSAAYEITTFRTESGYTDQRHPDRVTFLSSPEGDLARRDFTINAMAADLDGEILDCFGGLEDLERGILRCVGVPGERFGEDALRMLRALRFAARLGFSIEPKTANAIHAGCKDLHSVAPERLKKELSGILCGAHAAEVLHEFSDVLCVLIPEITPCIGFCQYNYHHKLDVWAHTLAVLDAAEPDVILRLSALLHDIGKPSAFSFDKNLVGHFYGHAVVSAAMCERILHRLRFDNATVQAVTELVRLHDLPISPEEKVLRKRLSRLGAVTLRRLIRLQRADCLGTQTVEPAAVEAETIALCAALEKLLAEDSCLSLRQLRLNGKDLIAMGIAPGKRLGELLNALLDAVLEERVPNEREALAEYVRSLCTEND